MMHRVSLSAAKASSRRQFSSVVEPSLRNFGAFPATQQTKLANGMTVVSVNNGSPLACVGVWVKTGSRYEKPDQAGAAHFLEHMFFKGSNKRNAVGLELEVEKLGAHVNAYTSRETSAYFSNCFTADYPHMVELLSDCIQHAELSNERIEIERSVILQELESVEGVHEEVVYDFLHYTAFREQALGRPILGSRADIQAVNKGMLEDFVKSHYAGDRMVFVGVGDIDHDQLAKTVETNFSSIAKSPATPIVTEPAHFTGSDYRHRLDSMEDAIFAYAFPYKGVKDPNFHAFGIIASMIGHYEAGQPHPQYHPSKLIQKVFAQDAAKSFKPVNMAYSDVGLFGVYATASPYQLHRLSSTIARSLTQFVFEVDETHFKWAKNAYKTDLLSHYRTTGIADITGVDVLLHGRPVHPTEVAARIDAVTIQDIKNAAEESFYDADFALAAFGNLHELPSYPELRTKTFAKQF